MDLLIDDLLSIVFTISCPCSSVGVEQKGEKKIDKTRKDVSPQRAMVQICNIMWTENAFKDVILFFVSFSYVWFAGRHCNHTAISSVYSVTNFFFFNICAIKTRLPSSIWNVANDFLSSLVHKLYVHKGQCPFVAIFTDSNALSTYLFEFLIFILITSRLLIVLTVLRSFVSFNFFSIKWFWNPIHHLRMTIHLYQFVFDLSYSE